jgi:hypothetical protein
VDLDEILDEDDGIEYYLDCILLSSVALTIPKWWTFKFLRWVPLLNRSVDLGEISYGDDDMKVTWTVYYLVP